jgi:hypothetical protein
MPKSRGISRTGSTCVDMRLHESHDEGRFGVPNNTITRNAASYNKRQVCCLPGHLCLPCSEGLAAGQRPPGSLHLGCPSIAPPPLARSSACTRTSCNNTTAPISRQQHSPRRRPAQAAALLPTRAQTCRLSTQAPRTTATANSFFRNSTASTRQLRGVGFPPASSGSQDQQPTRPGPIPSQCRLTQQLSKHWTQFKVLHQHYTGTRFEEQRQLNLPPKYKATNALFALK